ncbi:MAG: gliding motility-associated C-terminal domain-containing protein [Bacteroidetes bacterium]|nr:gliding motility-associated C-terminal domain-containing protein [Bacteroidota bacterium]
MKHKTKTLFFLVLLLLFSTNQLKSQCKAMPPKPVCTGTLLASGTTVLPSTVYYFNGGDLNTVNVNGGTIIICSGITNFSGNFNTGCIYIKKGAVFNTNINVIGTGCSIYNYGRANFNSGLFINSANDVMNAVGGVISINGNIGGNSCSLTNYGTVTATGQLGDWQNSGGVCQGNGASFTVKDVLWHSLDNWIQTPVGISCLSYSGTASSNNNHTVSANAGTNICQKASASNEQGNGTWGNATLNQNCLACAPAPCDPDDTTLAANLPNFCTGNSTLNLSNFDSLSLPGTWSLESTPAPSSTAKIEGDGFTFSCNNTVGGIYKVKRTLSFPAPGCPASSSRTFEIYALPELSFNLSDSLLCIQEAAINLNPVTPAGGILSGAGLVAGNKFSPSAAGAGVHAITYTYTDANKCSNKLVKNISVASPSSVAVNLSNTSMCIDASSVQLKGGSPLLGTYSGAGVNMGIFSPSAAGAGSHVISYSYNFSGACTITAFDTITVFALPKVSLNLSKNSLCVNEPSWKVSSFTPHGGELVGAGISGMNFYPSLAAIGSNTIKYQFTDSRGCTNSSSAMLTVSELPVVSFTLTNNTMCRNDSPMNIVVATPAGGQFTGSGVVGNQFNPSLAAIGKNSITYTYTNPYGCASSATSDMTVNPSPKALISDTTICEYTNVIFDAGAGFNSYLWSDAASGNQQKVTSTVAGKYTVTVSNQYNCLATTSAVLTINNLPKPDLGNDLEICDGEIATLNPQTNTSLFYEWTPSSTASTYKATKTGKYIVKVADNIGCFGMDSIQVLVHDLPFAIASNDTMMCDNDFDKLTLGVKYNGTKSIEWSDNTTNADSIVIHHTGNYWVKVIDSNLCATKKFIQVSEHCKDVTIDWPNVFTPNNDGLNDYFYPKNVNDDNLLEMLANIDFYKFEVYDRWGTLLYQTPDSMPVWDGTFNGQTVSPGTYYWTVTYQNKAKKSYQMASYMTVIY